MRHPRRKKVLAAAILPAYALLWVTGVACLSKETSAAIDFYLSCVGLGGFRTEQLGEPADGFELPGLTGDIVLGGVPDLVIANKKRTEILRTTFGMPASFPEADTTLYGAFNPFSVRGGEGLVKRPRKIFVEVAELDANGNSRSNVIYPLKVKSGDIRRLTKTSPEMNFAAGESMALYVKPKGADLSLEEVIQLFFEVPVNARMIGALQRTLASGAPLPGLFRPDTALRASRLQEISTTRFGIDVEMPRWQVLVGGNFLEGSSTLAARAGRPAQVKITMQHLDSNGVQQKKFVVKARITGNTIPQVRKQFPGFSVKAGDSIRTTIKPKGGDLEVDDELALFVIWFMN